MPTSPPMRRPDQSRSARRRGGFSLIEILVVLVMLGLASAILMPSTTRMLDQATAHAVFFEFQRDVSNLRREANRTGIALSIVDPAAVPDEAAGQRVITLRAPWRYTLAPTLDIAEGGVCGATTVNLLNGEVLVMTLRTRDGDCVFSRLQA